MATDFEFRHRFWIISAIFFLAFSFYVFQHISAVETFGTWLAGGRESPQMVRHKYVLGLLILAAVLSALAALVRTWGSAYLRSEVVHDVRLHSDRLVADGPFRHVRNPLYFGNLLLAVGLGLLASPVGFIVLVGLMWAFVYRLILREESQLAATQGAAYRDYCALVPRLLPAPLPRVPSAGSRPDWRQGLLSEAFIVVFSLTVIAFVATGRDELLNWGIAAAFAVYFVLRLVQHTRRG